MPRRRIPTPTTDPTTIFQARRRPAYSVIILTGCSRAKPGLCVACLAVYHCRLSVAPQLPDCDLDVLISLARLRTDMPVVRRIRIRIRRSTTF